METTPTQQPWYTWLCVALALTLLGFVWYIVWTDCLRPVQMTDAIYVTGLISQVLLILAGPVIFLTARVAARGSRTRVLAGVADVGLGLALVAVVVSPYLPGVGPQNAERKQRKDMQAAANTVRIGLEKYAVDHQGRYPEPTQVAKFLSQPAYMPGGVLPANPYDPSRPIGLVPVSAALPSAREVLSGFEPSRAKLRLGPGKMPDAGYDGATFGAVMYDVTPDRREYLLYAVGKERDKAYLVASLGTLTEDTLSGPGPKRLGR